ncbi:Non-specific serine/threonine protein kinase [Candidatus Accumulibacter aalborgensis]|uniref:Non-specific serine/threonine protein kinase n=1 Tax=Candidatus Accumulibacter aalborgensis TaxID=1860102 RepID=A0A1A8XYA8_9PROT|nr:SNF2-related protein [Candidatus Accumulibacter aalborgensis]SBT09954.1 Non-specific serine/threonine protein kinase [Candidatus Accumulibacter aalborgensis]
MNRTILNVAALEALDRRGLRPDTHKVALGSALLWTYRTPTELQRLMSLSGLPTTETKRVFSATDVKVALSELRRKDLLVDDPTRPAACQLVDSLRVPLYRQLLETHTGDRLARMVVEADSIDPTRSSAGFYGPMGGIPTTIAYVRAKFFSGAPSDELTQIRNTVARSMEWGPILTRAILFGFDGPSFERIEPQWRWQAAAQAVGTICLYWSRDFDLVADWAFDQLAQHPEQLTPGLREVLADLALQRGDVAALESALAGLDSSLTAVLRAARLVIDGQWAAGQAAFEAALKQRKSEFSGHKRLLPDSVAWLYPLALLAQQTPRHLELARKFCLTESGRREPDAYDRWGRWAHATDVRLGKTAIVSPAFRPMRTAPSRPTIDSLWPILLSAWIGSELLSPGDSGLPAVEWRETIESLRGELTQRRLKTMLRMLDGAQAVLEGRDPPRGFFVAGPGEQWREILIALQALAGEQPADAGGGETTRVLWAVEVGQQGELLTIKPLEQKRGPRGWSRPKALSLARIAGNEQLPTWDSKVARALRADYGYSNRYHLDLAAAIVALVGHPCVVLVQAPGQLVELIEAPPELELVRQGDRFVMRIEPPLRPAVKALAYYPLSTEERREAEALSLITLVPDGPQRLRLVRFSAAQRQAARLVSGRFAVPTDAPEAQPELDKTLRALAGHFQVHADSAQATRQVSSDARLHAELSPMGDALSLRLVVAPLGPEGPRLPPASGRIRLMAVHGTETIGTERDLTAERRNLEAVLDALPFLDSSGDVSEWLIEDPEQALGLVETLPTLPAIAAVEWPKGKNVRVVTVDTRQLGVRVSRERDWFRLSGQATLDEGLVVQLETLLSAAREKTRFVPMGNGVYAALTRSLKQKLSDLAAVLETDKDGAKAPTIAAAWLDEVLDGTDTQASKEFRQAIDRLRQAQATEPKLPSLLQATLRPYQEDGYQWAIRLATAGMGGCLADDMGLGKTLQALGVLLERAAGGAALVIAPTSVCGNWLAEAQRFAPTLNVRIYSEAGDSEREDLVTKAGPQDVLIVSYTLLLLAQERFAGRNWHTLVADEAQAIKNAAAKRSQAVFDLDADFRLAMTGTPVENRLADLWSIMRFVNPGLLGTLHRFNERFAGPIERNRDREAQHVLKRLVGPFILRRTKSEVLQDLPPRTELILTVTPEAAEAAHYEALRREAAKEIDATLDGAPEAQARFNILAQLTRLRRAACDPRLCSPEFGITGAKVQAFAELASELIAGGHKALVFSQFVDFLQVLREPLDETGVRYQYLDGATPAAERSRRVAAFQAGEGDLFLISLKAGGFGLNLTAADYVVITDPWWNPAAEDQAMGRAHRIGQLRPVTVYRLVTKGTVEERIVDLHHEKRALADSILAEGEASALPSTEDLVALIRGE